MIFSIVNLFLVSSSKVLRTSVVTFDFEYVSGGGIKVLSRTASGAISQNIVVGDLPLNK